MHNHIDNTLCNLDEFTFEIRYLDVVDGTNEVDVDAQNLLSILKDEKVSKALPDERNIEYFEVCRNQIQSFTKTITTTTTTIATATTIFITITTTCTITTIST